MHCRRVDIFCSLDFAPWQRSENQSIAAYIDILLNCQDFRLIKKNAPKLAYNNYTIAPKRKNKKNIRKNCVRNVDKSREILMFSEEPTKMAQKQHDCGISKFGY